jgi:hypothetical protein
MTTGAAHDVAQTMGWKHGWSARPREAKKFCGAIVVFTMVTVGINCVGINPTQVGENKISFRIHNNLKKMFR